jgi:hypothetical protein
MDGHTREKNPGLSIFMPKIKEQKMCHSPSAGLARGVDALMLHGKRQTEGHVRFR